MDEDKAKQIRPKLEALKTFIRNVTYLGHDMPDDSTRRNYRAICDDIKITLADPVLEVYAPPVPHLGTTSDRDPLRNT